MPLPLMRPREPPSSSSTRARKLHTRGDRSVSPIGREEFKRLNDRAEESERQVHQLREEMVALTRFTQAISDGLKSTREHVDIYTDNMKKGLDRNEKKLDAVHDTLRATFGPSRGGGGGGGGDDDDKQSQPETKSSRMRALLLKSVVNEPEAKDLVPVECFIPMGADAAYRGYTACTWCRNGTIDDGYWFRGLDKQPMCIKCASWSMNSRNIDAKFNSECYPQLCVKLTTPPPGSIACAFACACCGATERIGPSDIVRMYTIRAKAEGKIVELATCVKCWIAMGTFW